MAFEKVLLPFNLPCNLLVTQVEGGSPSHRTGNAIDLAPILHPNDPYALTKYINSYMKMVAHMKRGDLRINSTQSCWHFHYFLRSRDAWEFGYEHYCKQIKPVVSNGVTRQVTSCVKCGEIQQYSLKGPMASINFLNMLRFVRAEISADGSYSFNPVFSALKDVWDSFFIEDQVETFIEYNPKRFSLDQIEKLMSNFSAAITWAPTNTTYIVSPGESEDQLENGIFLTGLAALLYLYVTGHRNH